jgi:hypothetical protein
MTSKSMLLALVLTALNLGALALNLSISARATVAGMTARELARDRDFRQAVENVVEDCSVTDQQISC